MMKKHLIINTPITSPPKRVMLMLLLFLSILPVFSQQKGWGVITVSVCNMRTEADYDAGMATQGVLGMPVQILEDGSWLKVRTPEGYEAYVQNRSVQPMTRSELTAWNTAPQVVVTALWAGVYKQPNETSQLVGDAVATNRLRLISAKGSFYHVAFPDGRTGYLSKIRADRLTHWRKSLNNSAKAILATAKRFVGIPYMWGGMSPKGMDCSGFVRTVLLCHDIIIPRDASQMATKASTSTSSPHSATSVTTYLTSATYSPATCCSSAAKPPPTNQPAYRMSASTPVTDVSSTVSAWCRRQASTGATTTSTPTTSDDCSGHSACCLSSIRHRSCSPLTGHLSTNNTSYDDK